jgi:transcription antitermination factor NusG
MRPLATIPPPVITPLVDIPVVDRGLVLVELSLRDKCEETFLRTYIQCRHYSDRVKKVKAALFPGYLYWRFNPQSRLPILQTPGVQQVVGGSLGPTPIEESEISGLQRAVAQGLAAPPWPFLRCGDRVRIAYGSMAGVEGILLYEKGSHLLVISIELLQRSVAIEIGRDCVRPLNTTPIAATA